jgi:putative SOS response-associated peptidase YedK
MCGRYYIEPGERLDILLSYLEVYNIQIPAIYNAAPTDMIPVIYGPQGDRKMRDMRWWLHPSWSKTPPGVGKSYPTFNAKIETVLTLPSFRGPIRKQRAIVPGSAFIEWQKNTAGEKIPYYIEGVSEPLAFAAMYDVWHDEIWSCAIITQEPDDYFSKIHDRMPLTLTAEQCKRWLNPAEDVDVLLKDLWGASIRLAECEIDPAINNARNKLPAVVVGERILG